MRVRSLAKCLLAAVAAAVSGPVAVFAQGVPCGPRAGLVEALRAQFGETVRFRGLAADGVMIELLLAPAGTWSAVVTGADGIGCLVASGEAGTLVSTPVRGGADS